VREYLVNYARPLIYTTSMPPASLAAIKVAYNALQSPQVEKMREHLKNLILYTHTLLLKICAGRQRLVCVESKPPQSPIVPLFSPAPRQLAQYCQERGFIVRPIVAPTVPKGSERLRICLHAANTEKEVEALVSAIEAWARTTEEGPDSGQGLGRNARL
jgi:8-amino-7-oxononanoate synthase